MSVLFWVTDNEMYLVKYARSPYYQIVYSRNGKRTKLSTKERKKSDALKFLINFEANLKRPTISPISINEFRKAYLDYMKNSKSKSYWRSVKKAFEEFELTLSELKIDRIKKQHAESFVIKKFQQSKYNSYSYLRNLKAAFNKAIEWSYIDVNPFVGIKLPKIPSQTPTFINEIELKEIVENEKYELLKDIYLTLFNTGMRAGELCNLEWGDIDFEKRIIRVCNKEDFLTKNRKERSVPINNNVYKLLIKRFPKIINIKAKQYVFYRVLGVRLNVDYLSKNFKRSVKAAKLDNRIHLHSLRHSFASCLVQKGVSLYIIRDLLGHSDLKTTQIYSHLQQQNLHDAVNLLAQL